MEESASIYIKRFVSQSVCLSVCHVLFVPGGQTICLSPGGQTEEEGGDKHFSHTDLLKFQGLFIYKMMNDKSNLLILLKYFVKYPVRQTISCEQSSQVHGEKDGLGGSVILF